MPNEHVFQSFWLNIVELRTIQVLQLVQLSDTLVMETPWSLSSHQQAHLEPRSERDTFH